VPDNLVWAANDTSPALGQGSFPTCRHLYAGRRLRALAPPCDPAPWPSHQTSESAPRRFPTSASVGALLSTLRPVFALRRPARLLALLDRSDLERHRSPAAEDFFLSPGFPAEGHPPRESDIATRRPGADTVTGLSPVGALPLPAARVGEGTSLSGDALVDEQHRHFLDPPKIAVIGQEDICPCLESRRQLDRIGGSQPVPRPERGGTIGEG
jgi:hypothetical protein